MRWATPEAAADRRSTAGSTGWTDDAGTRICSAKAPIMADPMTRSPTATPSTPGPDGADRPGELAARREGDGHVDLVLVGHQQHVGKVDGGGGHVDHHLAIPGTGSVRDFLDHEGVGRPVLRCIAGARMDRGRLRSCRPRARVLGQPLLRAASRWAGRWAVGHRPGDGS